mmetsp:Transcript_17445/g.37697  ORF Transcript_17445/g.37697 Transcript_17445/m.37697 type:complete len:920 (+) Transcript_17445:159-2918(+)
MLLSNNQPTRLIIMLAWTLHCSLPTICYAVGNIPAFAVQKPPPIHKAVRPTRTSLFYKTIDPIETEQISSPPSNPNDEGDGTETESGIIEDQIFEDNIVEDKNDWLSAKRTLGSLFLRQEDANRDRNVDVFGRPLVGNETDAGDKSSFSLPEYLLNLKLQEEDNRERAAEYHNRNPKDASRDGIFAQQLSAVLQVDQKIAVSKLTISEELMSDMDILPLDDIEICAKEKSPEESDGGKDILRLSYPEHYKDRIGRDMRHLAVSIAASIDKPRQWKLFFDEGGGVLPLLECIRDGARAVELGRLDFLDDGDIDGTNSLKEQHEASFAAACTACRALRDLSALSKDFAAIVTDDILRVNSQWSTCVVEDGGYDCSSGGLISDLLILLKHANEAEAFYTRKGGKRSRRSSFSLSNRRQRRDARRRCGLYVVQLMLAMVVASDQAVTILRSTSGVIEAVVECSSYASAERFKRKWIRKPLGFIKRVIPGVRTSHPKTDSWVETGLTGQVQQNANKLLAAIGHNEWIPKLPGQRGLRVLCLDGGGTRGIAAVTSLNHIVKAMGGVEVCDAFDMIVGTSTGAIVGFLVGLRRESAADARIRYDTLIQRIFVKSLLKPIMLATTTASYDESNLMEVLEEILRDDGMLDSRANPAVPLVTAVSSKMSSSPNQLCLLRNYNYGGGEMPDSFCIDPNKARQRLGLEHDGVMETDTSHNTKRLAPIKCAPRTGKGSRYPGSFRVTQKIALRATTAAPTFFKPLLSFDELYVDGGIVASNPSAVAVHEARAAFPGVPLDLVVSVGTGVFEEVKVPPRVGWDGVVAQILDSATDAEQVHHVLEDVFGEGKTAQHTGTQMATTKYFRFNPTVGKPDSFPIDEIDPGRLQELCDIVDKYMSEDEQKRKLQQLGDIIHPKSWIQRAIQRNKEKNV